VRLVRVAGRFEDHEAQSLERYLAAVWNDTTGAGLAEAHLASGTAVIGKWEPA
jgi:hypothetical protein